mmetsp:Transcript_54436/g.129728  ORF Transcript_54436/g.129728 Transcript_54436/m.129728 type:complete len:150 (-) Transcript_54436:214-663(-)
MLPCSSLVPVQVLSLVVLLTASVSARASLSENAAQSSSCSSLLQLKSEVSASHLASSSAKDTPDSDVRAMIERDLMMEPDFVSPFAEMEQQDDVDNKKVEMFVLHEEGGSTNPQHHHSQPAQPSLAAVSESQTGSASSAEASEEAGPCC